MMKTLFKGLTLLALAALLAPACIVDPLVEETSVNSVQVTVGAGIAADPATKSTVVTENGARVLKFTPGDKLYVYGALEYDQTADVATMLLAGYLDMKSGSLAEDGKSAQFTGNLSIYQTDASSVNYTTGSYDFGDNDPLAVCYNYCVNNHLTNIGSFFVLLIHENGSSNFSIINDPRSKYFAAPDVISNLVALSIDSDTLLTTKALIYSEEYNSSTKSINLSSHSAPIFNCTISGLAAGEYIVKLARSDQSASAFPMGYGQTVKVDASGVASFAFIFSSNDGLPYHYSLSLANSVTNSIVYRIGIGNLTLEGKIYNFRRWKNGSAFCAPTDLASIDIDNLPQEEDNYQHSRYYTVSDGEILTGTFPSNCEIFIPDGATVVLAGVTHHAGKSVSGINCLGSANIHLASGTTNDLSRGQGDASFGIGIIKNSECTLSIRGTGSLLTTGGAHFPGIGGAYAKNNIIINGGNIIATGGDYSAGIGGGNYDNSRCGDITINGGTISATGGDSAAGIGGGNGYQTYCGNITINGGAITARGGRYGAGIGAASQSTCGDISFTGGTVVAYAGENASGIGKGYTTSATPCGDIRFTGGDITAYGGVSAATHFIYFNDQSQGNSISTSPFHYPVQ